MILRILTIALAAIVALPASAVAYYKPAGATITGAIQQDINSKTAEEGQRFTMVTSGGATIYGHISQVDRANWGKKAHLKLNFDSIHFPDGSYARLDATLENVQSHKEVNYGQAAGQAVGGMIVGNILGKAIGTNAGGAVGLVGGGLLAANTATNIDIPAGANATIRLNEPIQSGHPQAR